MEMMWHYLVNQFLNSTVRNFKKALKLSSYHNAILKKKMDDNPLDLDWAKLYNRYHSLHLALVNAYNTWKSSGGMQEGQTLNIDQLLTLLHKKINKWDVLVQNVYEKDTPEYKAIFPNGHFPFSNGAKDARVIAVKTLATTLDKYSALSDVKTVVEAFHANIENVRSVQLGAKGGTKSLSQKVEICRQDAMIMQYRNLGFLMDKLYDDLSYIEPIFDLNVLRDHLQVRFTGTLDANENEAVLIHTFIADDEIKVKVIGSGQVTLYLATTNNGTNSKPIVIDNISSKTILASDFGISEYGTHRYLTIINNSNVELKYEIELL